MKETILRKKKILRSQFATSLWLLIGGIVILGTVITFMTIRGIEQENRQLETFYEEKGASIITALEAGTRTDFRHNMRALRLQTLLEEMASQSGILFLMVTDANGKIIAHSNPDTVGSRAFTAQQLAELRPGRQVSWRIMEQGNEKAFVVYREFRPFAPVGGRPKMMSHMKMMGRRMGHKMRAQEQGCTKEEHSFRCKLVPKSGPVPVIYIGLDEKTFATAQQVNREHAVVNAVFILLIGLAGFLALTWAQKARQSRRRMQSSEALANEVMFNLPDGLLVTDDNGRIALLNDVALEQLNITDANVVGKSPSEVLPECVARLVELTGGEALSEVEVECLGKRGEIIPIGVSGSAVTLDDGTSIGYVYLLRDLREVRRLEAEVRRKEKLAAVGSLAAGVAHEIRNPLSSIKGYATYFGSRFEEGSEDREAANIMVHEVERLNRVITDLISLSRPSDLRRAETDLNVLAKHCFGLIKQDAAAHDVVLDISIDDTLPKLFVDPDRLSQAILNICLNSLEAMPQGGILTMNLAHTDNLVTLAISDTGKGISKEDAVRIFEPYYTTKSQGTGLGLAIVLKIIEAHGGTIRVKSQEGAGAQFIIEIPVSPVGENA
ncbi:ATP-binding protein [Halodesulfovibrio marinisediminis]|uniref:Sensor histidine kinase ZraS n=1 Tax=Halodesulfovibrio marinisediminis DSM 17456 TaxID=1121457 RepID=A0A1N6EWQ7_9BACT|nr:ATP-binding protein [Halodesulfovibrio marinisediminis]SIN87440.1 two-component system, NtrC family, sensor histidine kinase HydH [Halodesulfovibrio marinisediminis DSM 17456]